MTGSRWGQRRLRFSRSEWRNWSTPSLARSVWPLPKPNGMALYVLHFFWWNIVLEWPL